MEILVVASQFVFQQDYDQWLFDMRQILKKICDHPLLLTKRAAEDVLEELDSMLKPDDVCMAEKLAMHIADVAEEEDFDENHANLSCKISFIMMLLVRLWALIDLMLLSLM